MMVFRINDYEFLLLIITVTTACIIKLPRFFSLWKRSLNSSRMQKQEMFRIICDPTVNPPWMNEPLVDHEQKFSALTPRLGHHGWRISSGELEEKDFAPLTESFCGAKMRTNHFYASADHRDALGWRLYLIELCVKSSRLCWHWMKEIDQSVWNHHWSCA